MLYLDFVMIMLEQLFVFTILQLLYQ